jgi:hypothetical protein
MQVITLMGRRLRSRHARPAESLKKYDLKGTFHLPRDMEKGQEPVQGSESS